MSIPLIDICMHSTKPNSIGGFLFSARDLWSNALVTRWPLEKRMIFDGLTPHFVCSYPLVTGTGCWSLRGLCSPQYGTPWDGLIENHWDHLMRRGLLSSLRCMRRIETEVRWGYFIFLATLQNPRECMFVTNLVANSGSYFISLRTDVIPFVRLV
jgi:hypothetical protein